MKAKMTSAVLFVSIFIFSFNSCTDQSYKVTPQPVTLHLPPDGHSNPLTTLGRVLFYDTHLSVNNSISCASCHKQAIAFSDDKAFSSGFQNQNSLRNAIPIQNLDDNEKLFWDGREDLLQTMVLMPITNHVEMGMDDEAALIERVRNQPYYADLFQNAFNSSSNITATEIAQALSFFVKKIKSSGSRFDQNNLSVLEQQGKQLFFEKYECNSCHQTQSLSGGGGYGGGGGGGTIA
jgi:cytochrome c peroxidase